MCSDDVNDCLECALCVACCYACCLCCCKDSKNNATVGNYPNSPAIISQPQIYGGGSNYPHQDPYHGHPQQKDAYLGGGGSGYGYDNIVQTGGGQAPYPPVGQYGTPYHQPGGYQLPPGGPPPPYPYPHQQGPPAAPGSYFPPTHQFGDNNPPYYNPNAPQMYPNMHNMPEHGKY